jgi:nitrate reductase gamma subunit
VTPTFHALYAFAAGPLTWAGFTVLVLGLAWRVLGFFRLARSKDKAALADFRPGWAAASILRYILPLNRTVRASPWSATAGFAFHLSFLLLAGFTLGHAVLWDAAWGLDWPALPDPASDGLALAGLAGLAFLAARRVAVPAWRGLSSPVDFLVLALVALPLATGLLARWQVGLAHVVSGNVLLMAIPFTKLSHALFFFVSRAVTGSDFGKRQVGPW